MLTPEQIAHQVAGDWIMGPVNMGDLEEKIAAALRAYGDQRAAEERQRCIEQVATTAKTLRLNALGVLDDERQLHLQRCAAIVDDIAAVLALG